MSEADLSVLARKAGLQIEWEDAGGERQTVPDETLALVLGAIGCPAGSPAEIRESLERLEADANSIPPMVTGDLGRPILLPASITAGAARLTLESGGAHELKLTSSEDGVQAPAIEEPGYHRLETSEGEIVLAVAPPRAWTVKDAAPGRRLWGVGLQLYSLRERGSPGFGDFGALARFATSAAGAGADAVAISPVHALFAADGRRYAPYGPSTRLFLNGLYADPGKAGDASQGLASADDDLIDWPGAWAAKLQRLRQAFRSFAESAEAGRQDFETFKTSGGEDLRRHAVFEALHAHFLEAKGGGGWQGWPAEFQDPASPEVADFERDHAHEVEFHLFLQWLARRSLEAAQDAAKAAGMAVGLIADLAVGMDLGGSHAWSRREDLLSGLNVGAPPDLLGPSGQDWGVSAFSPQALRRTGYQGFIATLRAAMAGTGGVRIDHAMGLSRLWVVPHGAAPTEGAYLTYPMTDLLRLLALESWRARAIVIAEDLGTVPPGFRDALASRGVMGMQVLWFERDGSAFKPARGWSDRAAALTSTHDLPTVAGWWEGRDIDWTFRLKRKSPFATEAEARGDRAGDRQRLWRACEEAGAASGEVPPPEQPAPAVDAAIGFVAETPSPLALIQAEDLFGLEEQPNIPGTIDEHPNWRRRLPAGAEALFADPAVARRVDILQGRRGAR